MKNLLSFFIESTQERQMVFKLKVFLFYGTLNADDPNQGQKGLYKKVMTFSIFCRQQREKLQKNKRNLLSLHRWKGTLLRPTFAEEER